MQRTGGCTVRKHGDARDLAVPGEDQTCQGPHACSRAGRPGRHSWAEGACRINILLKANPRVQSQQEPKMGKHCHVNASCEVNHEKLPSPPKVPCSSAWLFLLWMSRHIWTPYPPPLQVIDNSESTQGNGKGWERTGGMGPTHTVAEGSHKHH